MCVFNFFIRKSWLAGEGDHLLRTRKLKMGFCGCSDTRRAFSRACIATCAYHKPSLSRRMGAALPLRPCGAATRRRPSRRGPTHLAHGLQPQAPQQLAAISWCRSHADQTNERAVSVPRSTEGKPPKKRSLWMEQHLRLVLKCLAESVSTPGGVAAGSGSEPLN